VCIPDQHQKGSNVNHAAKNVKGLRTTIVAVFVLVITAIWQFYLFASFRGSDGLFESQGGYGHLWGAIFAAVLAIVAAFFIFLVFQRRDREDELHITGGS
jgi:uncharacterized membrane protein